MQSRILWLLAINRQRPYTGNVFVTYTEVSNTGKILQL